MPCEEWNLAQVTRHLIGVNQRFAEQLDTHGSASLPASDRPSGHNLADCANRIDGLASQGISMSSKRKPSTRAKCLRLHVANGRSNLKQIPACRQSASPIS